MTYIQTIRNISPYLNASQSHLILSTTESWDGENREECQGMNQSAGMWQWEINLEISNISTTGENPIQAFYTPLALQNRACLSIQGPGRGEGHCGELRKEVGASVAPHFPGPEPASPSTSGCFMSSRKP